MSDRKFTTIMVAVTLSILLVLVGVDWAIIHSKPVHAASQMASIVCDSSKPINIAAANTQVITAGNANMFTYICSLSLSSAAATTFSVVEGTGAVCATNTTAVYGGTAAAVPLSTSPINYGGGTGAVMKTAVAGDNVCIFTAGTIAGGLSLTSAPY